MKIAWVIDCERYRVSAQFIAVAHPPYLQTGFKKKQQHHLVVAIC
jgi:hypothetical protein